MALSVCISVDYYTENVDRVVIVKPSEEFGNGLEGLAVHPRRSRGLEQKAEVPDLARRYAGLGQQGRAVASLPAGGTENAHPRCRVAGGQRHRQGSAVQPCGCAGIGYGHFCQVGLICLQLSWVELSCSGLVVNFIVSHAPRKRARRHHPDTERVLCKIIIEPGEEFGNWFKPLSVLSGHIRRFEAEYKMTSLPRRYTSFLQISRPVTRQPGTIAEDAAVFYRTERNRRRPAVSPGSAADILGVKRRLIGLSGL